MEVIEVAQKIVAFVADLIGIDNLLSVVFAHTGTERAQAILNAQMDAVDKSVDKLEAEKFGG